MHREVGERIGVYLAAFEIFGESTPAVVRKLGQALIEDNAILEGGVHPLSIKWYDSVSGQGPGNDPIGSGLLLSTAVTNGIGKANALGGLTLLFAS